MAIPRKQEQAFQSRFEEYSRTLDCVHCGLCIPACPTHQISGRESDSPRGRIYLMRGYAEETIPFTREVLVHLDRCIVCRNCDTVCPSGINMGDMMESFRSEMNRTIPRKGWRYHLTRFLLRAVIPHRQRLAFLTNLLYVYERLGLRRVARTLGRFGPSRFRKLERLMPPIPSPSERRIDTDATIPGGLYPAFQRARMRVVLFLGCITSQWFAKTHRATIRMLNRAGCDVIVPAQQTCCGALHRHSGFLQEARDLHRRNSEVFSRTRADVLVVNAAGCGAALKEPPREAPPLGLPVRDVCELLDEIGIPTPTRRYPRRVAHDQPCHLVHAQGVPASAVEDLLRQIPGLELVDLANSDSCCGAGGVYNLMHPEMAEPILDAKVRDILASGAETVVTGNPGCWMQIRAGLTGHAIEILHPIDLLDRCYSDGDLSDSGEADESDLSDSGEAGN